MTVGLVDSACGSPAATLLTSGCHPRQSGPSAAGLTSLHYTEYCTSAQAQDMAAGPDGGVWFAEGGLGSPNAYVDRIGRITNSGVATEFPIPKTDWFTSALTGGPDGALWFVGYGSARVGRITTSGVVTMYDAKPFPDTILSTIAITSGPDGALWFTIQGGYVGRITTSGQVTTFLCNPCSGRDPTSIAVGSDGALWFTVYWSIYRMTTGGSFDPKPEASWHPDPRPDDVWANKIAVGPDGALWFTESANEIGRITKSGVVTQFPIPAEQAVLGREPYPSSITAGSDGALWFTEPDNKIGRITTSGAVTEYPVSSQPSAITSGPDRAIWFAEAGNRIGRLSLA
jgi:virginiamycin B lyase